MAETRTLVRRHHGARKHSDVCLRAVAIAAASRGRAAGGNSAAASRTIAATGMATWWRRRLLDPLLALLRQGVAPRSLALAVTLGAGIGIFPVLGISTLVLTALALPLRLNLPAIQLVNYAVSPLQLLLIIPFLRLGETLLGAPRLPMTLEQGLAILASGISQALVTLSGAIFHAAVGWFVVMPLTLLMLYRVLASLMENAARKLKA